jgi:hypothetical protein
VAQTWDVGVGAARVVSGQSGVAVTSCGESGTSTMLHAEVGRRAAWSRVVARVRGPILLQSATCVSPPLPPTGRYEFEEGTSVFRANFLATDVRAEVRTPPGPLVWGLAFGVGNAWRIADDAPYGIVAMSLGVRVRPWLRARADGEVNEWWVQRARTVYQDGRVLAGPWTAPRRHTGGDRRSWA